MVEAMKPDDRLQAAIGKWILTLNEVDGWQEWKRQSTGAALWYDDELPGQRSDFGDFYFPDEIEKQHAIITGYYALHSTLSSLRDCEFYFRRFPFAGLPVQKHDHLRYICEMYFGRFYEFKSRLKELVKFVNAYLPEGTRVDGGPMIKAFDKEFDQEHRARNGVHHHNRFEDVAIDNLSLLAIGALDAETGHNWKRRNDAAYRKASRIWAARVVRRSRVVESYLDMAAMVVLSNCAFLSDLAPSPDSSG